MSNLSGDVGELRFTVQITRKDTGKTEEIELVGKLTDVELKELSDGSDSQHSGEKRGD